MFFKVKDSVNANIFKSIYYALFESHINYGCIIWGQNISTIVFFKCVLSILLKENKSCDC